MIGSTLPKASAALALLLALCVFSSAAFACQCNTSGVSSSGAYTSGGSCCANITVVCTSCGNCNSAHVAAGSCRQTGGNFDHGATMWKSFTCCNPGYDLSVNITGGDEAGYGTIWSANYSCCTPSSAYSPYCGQSLGCGYYNYTYNVGDYVNNCDNTDGCSNTRSTYPYNSCSYTSAQSCNNESTAQCDGVDNDCDGYVDYETGVTGLECAKDNYNPTYSSGGLTYYGDCTSACRVCKDNKVDSLRLTSAKTLRADGLADESAPSDSNTVNALNSDTSFDVRLNASSPNDCITGYNFELQYSADNGASWARVQSNAGVGENNFNSAATGTSLAEAPAAEPAGSQFLTVPSPLSGNPFGKALFAPGKACVSTSDCNAQRSEACVDGNCNVFSYSRACSGNDMLLRSTRQLASVPCFGGCSSDANGLTCEPESSNVCDGNTLYDTIYSLDANGKVSFVRNCDQSGGERCVNGSCCKADERECSADGRRALMTDSCGNSTTITCDASGGESCVFGYCCAPTSQTRCSDDASSVVTIDSCGNPSILRGCNAAAGESCVDGNRCCAPNPSALSCGTGAGSNKVYMTDTCGRKIFQQDCGTSTCSEGKCCVPNYRTECRADTNTVMNVYDSCGTVSTRACDANKVCTGGYCLTSYAPANGEGYKSVSTSSKTYRLTFSMRYMPVNYKYRVRAQLIDAKAGNNTSGAAYKDSGWLYSNVITVLNTVPSKPSIAALDRNISANSSRIYAQVGESSDPDVFASPFLGSQTLTYFARIFPDENKANPGSYGTRKILGGFSAASAARYYSQPLTMERVYCAEGRAYDGYLRANRYDGNDYSPVSDQFCGSMVETPFQPNCSHLGISSQLASVSCNNPPGKTTVAFNVSCARDPQMDEDWKVLVMGIDFAGTGGSIPGRLVNQLSDCNSSPQVVYATFDSNVPGSYSYRLSYGGTYNSRALNCRLSGPSFTVAEDDCGTATNGATGACQQYGFSAVMIGASPRADGRTDFNFSYVCTGILGGDVNSVAFYRSSGGAVGAPRQFGPALPCSSTPRIFGATMDSNALSQYTASFTYAGACSASIGFSLTRGGFSSGAVAPPVQQIPDSSALMACLVLLAAIALIARRRK